MNFIDKQNVHDCPRLMATIPILTILFLFGAAYSGFARAEEKMITPVPAGEKPAAKYSTRAGQLCRRGDYERGLALFARAIEMSPAYDMAYFGRAICRLDSGDFKGALNDCNQGIELDRMVSSKSFQGMVYNMRAMIYLKMGTFDKGLVDADLALSLSRTRTAKSDVYDTRGHIFLGLERLDDALADFDKGLQINPKLIPSYWGRGQVFERLGLKEKAIADYRKAITLPTGRLAENRLAKEKARKRLRSLTATGPSCKRDECVDL